MHLTNKKMKNETTIPGNWNELKGKLKQKYAKLTDDDVLLVEGKSDEMLGRLKKNWVKPGKRCKSLSAICRSYGKFFNHENSTHIN